MEIVHLEILGDFGRQRWTLDLSKVSQFSQETPECLILSLISDASGMIIIRQFCVSCYEILSEVRRDSSCREQD